MRLNPGNILSVGIVVFGFLMITGISAPQAAGPEGSPDLSGLWADEPLILPSSTDGTSVCIFNCDDLTVARGNRNVVNIRGRQQCIHRMNLIV